MSVSRIERLLASHWPQHSTPGMLQRPSAPQGKACRVHTKSALSGRTAEHPSRDLAAPCSHAAVSVRPRRPTMACPPAERRTHPATRRRRCIPGRYPGGRYAPRCVHIGEVSCMVMVASRRRGVHAARRMEGLIRAGADGLPRLHTRWSTRGQKVVKIVLSAVPGGDVLERQFWPPFDLWCSCAYAALEVRPLRP